MSANVLCIYHGNCADGFGAACAVKLALGDSVEFFPGVYQNNPPDVRGKKVVIVDFSYRREVLEKMAETAVSILVLDHHKTAQEDLAGFPEPPADLEVLRGWLPESGIYARFSMEKSGAVLAWEHFHAVDAPALINHIQDRDLWKFELPGTREIQAALFSYPYDFEVWTDLILGGNVERLRADGEAIERKHHKDVAELTRVVTRMMLIGGEVVPVANLPYTLTSDAGHLLCGDPSLQSPCYPFAGCYWDTPQGRVFSLRSREDGADVGAIAKFYGGGGHKHASGFRVPFDELAQFEVVPSE